MGGVSQMIMSKHKILYGLLIRLVGWVPKRPKSWLCNIWMAPYGNVVTLTEQNLFLKSCQSIQLIQYLLRRLRSFHRVWLCRSNGCKVMSCQSKRFDNNSAAWLESYCMRAARVQLLDKKIVSKVWGTTTLQLFYQ